MKVIVAMRGRNPDNPSERVRGAYVEQRLEVNSEGICNCITTVQKDNLVLETSNYGFNGVIEIRSEDSNQTSNESRIR